MTLSTELTTQTPEQEQEQSPTPVKTYGSDIDGLRELAKDIGDAGLGSPQGELVKVESDGEGPISVSEAAKGLSAWRERRAQELAEIAEVAEVEEAPNLPELPPEEARDLSAMSADELRNVLRSDPDESKRVAASQVLEQRLREYEGTLGEMWRGHLVANAEALAQSQQQAQAWLDFALEMSAAGFLAKHGLQSLDQLEAMRGTDPQRHAMIERDFAQLRTFVDNAIHHYDRQVRERNQVLANVQVEQFARDAAANDEAFWKAHPELKDVNTKRAAAENAVGYLVERLGIAPETVVALWESVPMFRSAEGQTMLYDASRYYHAKKSTAGKLTKKPAPPVQKPGSSAGMSAGAADDAVKRAEAAMNERPTAQNAAKLLSAKRRAAEARGNA